MNKVVVISGHPHLDQSHTNKVILDELQHKVEGVDIRHLASFYPDCHFDIEAEQAALLRADTIVLQFPFYWYSVPGIMKQWLDAVLTFNFAYGPEGDKLKGKHLVLSFTIGGPRQSYHPLGYNHFSIEQLMTPLEQTAYLAGLNYHQPIYSHGMIYIPGVYNTLDEVEARAREHADRLITTLAALAQDHTRQAAVHDFVRHWFKAFDRLPQDPAWFIQHVDDALHLMAPDGTFRGTEGFCQWYQTLRLSFTPGIDHQLERVEVSHLEKNHYQVDLLVRVEAETLNNEATTIMARETWRIAIDPQDNIKIFDYRVELV